MASGSFNFAGTGSTSRYITFRCDWSSTPNASTNSSSVRVKIYAIKSSQSTASTYGYYISSAVVDGQTQSRDQTNFTLLPNQSIQCLDKVFTVKHDSNGTKACTITCRVGGNVMSGYGTATVTLDKITPPTPSAVSSFKITAGYGNYVGLGDTITLTWTKPSGTVTGYDLQYSRGNSGWSSWKTVTGTSTTDSFTSTNINVNGAGCAVKYRIRAKNGSYASAWTESNTLYITGGMDLKVSNAWKTGSTWINVNGTWKRAKRVWIKINGTWQYSK